MTARVTAPNPAIVERVRDALGKYADGDTPARRSVDIVVAPATSASVAEARALRPHASVEYQFVFGHAGAEVSTFATGDGSLARLTLATRRIDLTVTPDVFHAPYSTWADFVAAPLAELWRHDGCHPLHAAAVTHGHHTVLIVGASGAGKTTTALALLQAPGSTWRADDKILLSLSGGSLRGITLYCNTNVAPATIRAFAALRFAEARPPLDETNDKRACLLDEVTDAVDLRAFAPTAVVFPTRTGGTRSRLTRLDVTAALLRLAGQSPMSAEFCRARAHHEVLCRLATTIPGYLLEAGTDVLDAPGEVAGEMFRQLDAADDTR